MGGTRSGFWWGCAGEKNKSDKKSKSAEYKTNRLQIIYPIKQNLLRYRQKSKISNDPTFKRKIAHKITKCTFKAAIRVNCENVWSERLK